MMRVLFILIVSCFCFESAVADSDPVFISQQENWEVYTQIEDGQKVCFIVSTPVEMAGNYMKRGSSYIWVRHINKNVDEVSVTPGYRYKTATFADLGISVNARALDQMVKNDTLQKARAGGCVSANTKGYVLSLTEGEQAWARDSETDQKIVMEMKKGYYAFVSAKSNKDTCSVDVYSLVGFSRAYAQMKSLCK